MIALSNVSRPLLEKHRATLLYILFLSCLVNLLMLTGAIYMLQVYDRVLLSKSGATLFYLTLIMLVLYAALHLFDEYRQKVLSLIGRQVEESLGEPVFIATLDLQLRSAERDQYASSTRDLEEVGRFISSAAPIALFDLPWLPLFVGICFLFHPLIGLLTVISIIFVILLTIYGELASRNFAKLTASSSRARNSTVESALRNAEVIAAMGSGAAVQHRVNRLSQNYLNVSTHLAHLLISLGGITRSFRMVLQSFLLGVAAWLVINDEATPGVMIASSIIASRALAPIDALVGRWRAFTQVRESWNRIHRVLEAVPTPGEVLALPPPTKEILVRGIAVGPAGSEVSTVKDVSFALKAGDALGIIGPSGSGKSTLVRGLIDVWPPTRGDIRFDGALLRQHPIDQRARIVGYLPQDVQLLRGTVAENICRFEPTATASKVIEAAKAAGAHEMILALPSGYLTDVGENGNRLSGGQRQRIGLARALFGDPFLLVLDEPNSNLDANGEGSLAVAIRDVRARGGIVVIVAHRMSALRDTNKLLLLVDGQVQAFGAREDVLNALSNGVTVEPGKAGKLSRPPQQRRLMEGGSHE